MLSALRCCCGPPPVLASCCRPCVIPKESIQFTEKFYSYDTSGFPFTSTLLSTQTITLTYNDNGGPFDDTWTGSMPCPDGISRTVTLRCNEDFAGANTGTIDIEAPRTQTPFTLQSRTLVFIAASTGPFVGTYTCSPFHSTSDFFEDDGNGFYVVPVGRYEIEDVLHDAYQGTCCLSPITLLGCGDAIVPGATYSVWSDGSKGSLIASGATDSNGLFTFDAGFCGVTLYREITHPRFADLTGDKTYSGGGTDTISTPVSGYHCLVGTSTNCGWPVADTLHVAFAAAGSKALTYSSGAWGGSWTTSGHSYVMSIGAATGALTLTRDGVSCGATLTVNSCPPSLSIDVNIPPGDCLTELGAGTITE